jgi:hypothetical protein
MRKEANAMLRRRALVSAPVAAVAACSLLLAGCGGSSSRGVAGGAASTTTTTSATTTTTQNGALAFAQCLRAHGLSKWPDPTSGGEFDKAKLRQTGYGVSQVRAVEDGPCKNLVPSSPAAPTINAAERTAYLKAAACMRSHGFANFPDPTFPNSNIHLVIPSSINQDAASYRSAATICTKLIPAGLPYSSAAAP